MKRPLPTTSRIAIMGAGSAGLTCAEELRERGFRHITIFEAKSRAGGKIRSIPYAGAPPGGRGLFEAGTVFFIPSRMWTKLLRRHRVMADVTLMPKVRLADARTGTSTHLLRFSAGHSLVSRLWQTTKLAFYLRQLEAAHTARPGIAAHAFGDQCGPMTGWLDARGLTYVRDVVMPIIGAAQFGPLANQVPAVYVLRLLALLVRYSASQQIRRTMPQLRAGHQALWSAIAATHDVRVEQAVTRIVADREITIEAAGRSDTFDVLIVAAPTSAYLDAATHLSVEERADFEQVRTLSREVVTARIDGLDPSVFYSLREDAGSPVTPRMFYEVDRGSGVYTFHRFVGITDAPGQHESAVRDVVMSFGGRLRSIEHRAVIHGWFPHFTEAALRSGAYQRIEAMQGQRNVWLAGELLAGIGVPHGIEYAAALVSRMTDPAYA